MERYKIFCKPSCSKYEYDIEVYDHKGDHVGSMNPIDGTMYKGFVKGRIMGR